jgi:hypothetical protein
MADQDLDREKPIPYDEFDSGLSFQQVRDELDQESRRYNERTGQYMFVSRSTVLGRMKERKEALYARYLRHFHGRRERPGRPWTWGDGSGESPPPTGMVSKAEAEALGLPF